MKLEDETTAALRLAELAARLRQLESGSSMLTIKRRVWTRLRETIECCSIAAGGTVETLQSGACRAFSAQFSVCFIERMPFSIWFCTIRALRQSSVEPSTKLALEKKISKNAKQLGKALARHRHNKQLELPFR